MVIYLAAPWKRRAEARLVRDQIVAAGHVVNSRWLDVDETTTTEQAEARTDLTDVAAADLMVVLNLELSEGKAVEQGYALALEMPIVVVGTERLNVFQHLAHYRMVPDVAHLLAYLHWMA